MGSLFIGVGYNGLRITSADGRTWNTPTTGREGEIYRTVAFGNGLCVAAGSYGGSNLFAVSPDGTTWKSLEKDAGYSRYIRGLIFAQGTFFGLGGDGGSVGASVPFETHSTDGTTWSEPHGFEGNYLLRRAAFGSGKYVGVGDRGRRAVSTDGRAWKDLPNVKAIDTLVDVAFGNGVFVGVGLNGLRQRTVEGQTWTDRQLGEEGEHLNSILWTGENFVAVGFGVTFTSPDGRKWTRLPNHNAPLTAAYGNGVYVGTQWKGRLLFSTDAVAWKEVKKCDYHVEALGFGTLG
jgi:hypothetical protein